MDTPAIIGFVLFALSELLPLLPIPTNGLLHSFVIGLSNSLKNANTDIDLAKNVLDNKPQVASLVNQIGNIPELKKSVETLINNPQLIPQIDSLNSNPQLQYINTILHAHPELVESMKGYVEKMILTSVTIE